MKMKKFVGIFNLIVSGLLFAIIFLSTIYELNAYASYVNSLEEGNIGYAFAVLVIIVFMLFSAPLSLVFGILTLIAGLKTVRGKCGKGMVVMGVIAKILSAVGLSFLFFIYLDLYPAGWISKATYLLTAVLALGSTVFDFVAIRFFKKEKPALQEELIAETEAEAEEEIATTEE
ncbi:MAG: hypothetical protein E7368_05540 [Clostridiales bacterium]|nr:hypothetical protein [Clostridiales bacterium]